MPHVCSQCSRSNPEEARFCYWDGVILVGGAGGGPVQVGSAPFPNQFVFPNGQACRNFDQLALACYQQWQTAVSMLKQGYLSSFLGGLGRLDLATAAQEAAAFPDPDRGLDQFLARLPTDALQPPVLKAEPTEINLGLIPMGTDRTLELQLSNQGMRLCYGSVASDSKWLTLGDAPGQDNKIFQFGAETAITVNVRGQHLRAGNKPIEGHLIVESNGGNFTITVRAEVPTTPFPDGMFAGALAPRQIAEKAKSAPMEAAPFFENGAVARWYASNGWPYPVQGPTVPGIGGVQQFFEALGLAKPPKVELKTPSLHLRGDGGVALQGTIEIGAAERKVVWAYATCDQPWVDVSKWRAGKQAVVTVSIPRVPNRPHQTINANIQVTANGNQKFTVPLRIDVGAPSPFGDEMPPSLSPPPLVGAQPPPLAGSYPPMPSPMPAVPVPAVPMPAVPMSAVPMPAVPMSAVPMSAVPMQAVPMEAVPMQAVPMQAVPMQAVPMQATPLDPQGGFGQPLVVAPPSLGFGDPGTSFPSRPARKSGWMHFVPLGLLFFVILGFLLRDMIAESPPPAGVTESVDPTPRLAVVFDWGTVGKTPENSFRFGVSTVKKLDGGKLGLDRLLTRDEFGQTNSIVALLDDKREVVLGKITGGDRWIKSPDAPKESSRAVRLEYGKDRTTGSEPLTVEWGFGENVSLTQRVQIIPGEPLPSAEKKDELARQLDTVLVRYTLKNNDGKLRKVGLRVVMDSYLGSTDGAPFLVAGEKSLVDTMKQIDGATMPDFLQAQEFSDLDKPGIVLRVGLNLTKKLEPPGKVLITRWPNHPDTDRSLFNWNTSPGNMRDDSAIILYWLSKELKPGETRELGFTYGLGSPTTGPIAVSTGGAFEKDGKFSVVARFKDAKEGASAEIVVPEGLKLVEGEKSQKVPTPFRDEKGALQPNPITWRILAEREGRFAITIRSEGKDERKFIRVGGGVSTVP